MIFIGFVNIVICVIIIYFAKKILSQTLDKIENKIQAKKSELRFGNSDFVASLIQDFRARNWLDLDYKSGGCKIFGDKIVTPQKTYLYNDYGLKDLDYKGCKLLATYIGETFGNKYKIGAIEETYKCVSNSYTRSISDDSNVAVYKDYLGYIVYSVASSLPHPKPERKDW